MFVNFKKIKFKNILSYGNKFTEIEFKNGLNLINAVNGAGKSTILDALSFVLFGKPYRDIKLAQLINKYNLKDLYVSLDFEIGKDKYNISRGLKPSILEISKNEKPLDKLSSNSLNQDEINKLIGIDYNLFKNIVAVAATNVKPFMLLSPAEKRKLIDGIFNINILADMLKEVKRRNIINKNQQKLQTQELEHLQKNILTNKSFIEEIVKLQNSFDNDKLTKITNIKNNIKNKELEIEKRSKYIIIGTNKLEQLENGVTSDERAISDSINKINSELLFINKNISLLESNLSKLDGKPECPICKHDLSDESGVNYVNNLKNEISDLKSKKENFEKKLLDLKEELTKAIQDNKFKQTIKDKIKEEKDTINNCEKLIKEYNKEIIEEDTKKMDVDITTYENKIQLDNNSIIVLNKKISESVHQIQLDEDLIEMLGDDGIKTFFFRQLLPELNTKVNAYLKAFELNVSVEFDESLDSSIYQGKYESSYSQFSGGERSKINMAILLSFFDISKTASNWSCSLLFIDEVLDQGVDSNGIEKFLNTLYDISKSEYINDEFGIYLVSHKLADVQIDWNSITNIEKKGMFSKVNGQ